MKVQKLKPTEEERLIFLQLRLPHAMHEKLKKLAAEHYRSMNHEILWCISQHIKESGE
jgi:hypothetical protein